MRGRLDPCGIRLIYDDIDDLHMILGNGFGSGGGRIPA